MMYAQTAKFGLGQIVRHRENAFRGVIVDVDPAYAGPAGDTTPEQATRPFYQIFASGTDSGFVIYAAEEMLEIDPEEAMMSLVDEAKWFRTDARGRIAPRAHQIH